MGRSSCNRKPIDRGLPTGKPELLQFDFPGVRHFDAGSIMVSSYFCGLNNPSGFSVYYLSGRLIRSFEYVAGKEIVGRGLVIHLPEFGTGN